tara:strand:- start:132 stop:800 length:669 start_codon:yes stop_codon:yes gene_type:complete
MQIKIHKEGWVYFIITLIISIILLPIFPFIAIFFFILSLYIYYFFRDPIRSIPLDDLVVSPADGVVTFIGEADSPLDIYKDKKLLKISIFLNIFNVHVNRVPISGLVKSINYIHGKFLNATLDKSSDDNERNIIVLEKDNKDIFIVVQIAGLIARRIVCEIKENQMIKKGNRFGIIKFGSRVDLYLPKKYNIQVAVGQSVIGGETIVSNPNNIKNISGVIRN